MYPGPFAYLSFPGRLSDPDDGKLFGGEHVQPGHCQLLARVLLEQRQPGQPVVLPHCCRAGPLSPQAPSKPPYQYYHCRRMELWWAKLWRRWWTHGPCKWDTQWSPSIGKKRQQQFILKSAYTRTLQALWWIKISHCETRKVGKSKRYSGIIFQSR